MQTVACSLLASMALVVSSVAALPSPTARNASTAASKPLPHRTIFQFEQKSTWIENFAVGPSGDLYFTSLWPEASLYEINDPSGPAPNASVVSTIPGAQGLSGITAISKDTYVVAAGGYSALTTIESGTGALWSVRVPTGENKLDAAVTKKIADIPEAGFLNGLVMVPQDGCGCHCNTTVLAADSFNGLVWRVNIITGKYDIAIKVPQMDPSKAVPFGVNGIRIMNGYLYWTNAASTTIYRLSIDAQGNPLPEAAVETVFYIEADQLDDFTVDAEGNFWVCTNADNRIIAITPDGKQTTVLGGKGSLTVAGDTSVRFGRGANDGKTLYVTTGGANGAPVNGTVTEPAKVVSVDTSSFY